MLHLSGLLMSHSVLSLLRDTHPVGVDLLEVLDRICEGAAQRSAQPRRDSCEARSEFL
jgi:hypothetical protein